MITLPNGAFQLEHSKGANGYLIPLEDSYVLIDPGLKAGGAAVITELQDAGVLEKVTDILLTHGDYDHSGAAVEVGAATGATLWIGRAEVDLIEGRIKSKTPQRRLLAVFMQPALPSSYNFLGESDGFPGQIEAVYSPGHTPGHYSFVWNRALFCGDAVEVTPNGELKQFKAIAINDKKLALETTPLLEALDVDWVFPGHGKIARRKE